MSTRKNRRVLLFLVILGFFTSMCSKSREVDQSKIQERGGLVYVVNETNPYTGKIIERFHNNQKKNESEFKNGKMTGKLITYYENGQIAVKGNFRDAKQDGKWIYYDENGQITQEENYKNDKKDGKWISYDTNGQISEQGNYKDDRKDGEWILYYNGQISEKGSYKDGDKDGKWIIYDENGSTVKEENYNYGDGFVKSNMHTVQLAVEDYCVLADGLYPTGLDVKTSEICDSGDERTLLTQLPGDFKNPINPQITPLKLSLTDPPNWSSVSPGQVVYVPLKIEGKGAKAYKIYGK